ncbi:hypothetical protein [Demequina sp. NBRC 110056]|uniref:hypothetical protein n=1 Tax=Demequina sp. NBRC 110056 TaxID=1570345 RepID=UPI00117FA9D2|nr:hypothetical protein [Demequina sp. NBRC 110056]
MALSRQGWVQAVAAIGIAGMLASCAAGDAEDAGAEAPAAEDLAQVADEPEGADAPAADDEASQRIDETADEADAAPADAAEDAAGSSSQAGEATLELDGRTYGFTATGEAVDGICRILYGGMVASMILTSIDGEEAPDDAGQLQLTVYPEDVAAEQGIVNEFVAKLPSYGMLAASDEALPGFGVEPPPVALTYADASVSGEQPLIDFTGAKFESSVEVACS